MKKLCIYLFLVIFTLQTSSQADDIRDFQIEGISIGGSLLDYMSEEEIKENVVFVYKDKKFTVSMYNKSSEIYDSVGITYKSNDKKYKIYEVQGLIDFPNNIENCYEKQDEIEKEISSMFDEIKKEDWGILIFDKEEGSTYRPIVYEDNNGDAIQIGCFYYPNAHQDNHLKITMDLNEFKEYLKEDAVPANN